MPGDSQSGSGIEIGLRIGTVVGLSIRSGFSFHFGIGVRFRFGFGFGFGFGFDTSIGSKNPSPVAASPDLTFYF